MDLYGNWGVGLDSAVNYADTVYDCWLNGFKSSRVQGIKCVRICVFRPIIVSVLFKFQSVSRMRVTSQNPCVRTACFS